ncbi:site-specific DNA-methyltransferase [Candidatus Symbiobacter mobilis CR]|uniref:site-specific DNA-methyltransferase (adenine-specific) n=2 Tax=Candidatus Symbiobacter TaxID=1436289 RepID=U5N4M3_9BURK|nr:site-specific DNA-methyltransferase [Candidatus Symbiobacter mobilis CR]
MQEIAAVRKRLPGGRFSSTLEGKEEDVRVLTIEQTRLEVSKKIESNKKSQFGQFFTPSKIAMFMASLFPDAYGNCRLLDAGAGIGSLSDAFLERWQLGGFHFHRVELDAFEIDDSLKIYLQNTLHRHQNRPEFSAVIRVEDFIHAATEAIAGSFFASVMPQYTHAILNPPYKKINSDSAHRLALRTVGIETVNLYSAFVALAVAQAAPGGQIVAIIPRSFCNGPYYRPFRDFILERAAIRHIHLFESRNKAFQDDEVLQENIIIRLERGGKPGPVTITTSTDDSFTDLVSHEHSFDRIVFPDDSERFIHVPTSLEKSAIELSPAVRYTLAHLGIKVSTGPVVDFRLKEHLRDMPEEGAVPLVYPGHLGITGVVWPVPGLKKPNAILRNDVTEKWLYPNGFYCVVRRFSSKEEKRRVVASVVDPSAFGNHTVLGFENHINLFHENKRGLPALLARGLAMYLNTTAVDDSFRRFNGHTQVNATDLMLMKYPSREALIDLGKWVQQHSEITQDMIDEQFRKLIA